MLPGRTVSPPGAWLVVGDTDLRATETERRAFRTESQSPGHVARSRRHGRTSPRDGSTCLRDGATCLRDGQRARGHERRTRIHGAASTGVPTLIPRDARPRFTHVPAALWLRRRFSALAWVAEVLEQRLPVHPLDHDRRVQAEVSRTVPLDRLEIVRHEAAEHGANARDRLAAVRDPQRLSRRPPPQARARRSAAAAPMPNLSCSSRRSPLTRSPVRRPSTLPSITTRTTPTTIARVAGRASAAQRSWSTSPARG